MILGGEGGVTFAFCLGKGGDAGCFGLSCLSWYFAGDVGSGRRGGSMLWLMA